MTWLVAHRGGAALEMENTERAFDRACEFPVDGLECDLQLSKDGVPLLFHDRSLFKFKLAEQRIKNFTWHELQNFKTQTYKKWKISGEFFLSYERFLERYNKQSRLFIELKSRVGDRVDGTSEKLLKAVLKVHHKNKPSKKTIFMSFDATLMKQAHEKLSAYQHIQLAEDPEDLKQKYLDDFFGIGLPLQKVNPSIVDKFQKRGLKVLVYTCNGPRQLKMMKKCGVDIIVSDRPDWLTQAWSGLS